MHARCYRIQRDASRGPKLRFMAEAEALEFGAGHGKLRRWCKQTGETLRAYLCDVCQGWHLTTTGPDRRKRPKQPKGPASTADLAATKGTKEQARAFEAARQMFGPITQQNAFRFMRHVASQLRGT